ncbi:hypothetical protein IMG5_185370 [Ichthyophthirius multifiliis]|uniref:Uncharacterized protein n=1 Tax=Ichthyophthirius multifiliis TaxID=5932 RepID=G0R3G5_ICHMU|nr:hypothetical protein IMG5_185370 [Ichthyophthirius multifiliis]EGR27954.1 hypothetical protein IMG5_185370 [Ichthyophthirius multifiliis]|eukprot:XP_004027299.1 hypothetical protein IMG5_185370 [Ichthyophthirius multifiliis]
MKLALKMLLKLLVLKQGCKDMLYKIVQNKELIQKQERLQKNKIQIITLFKIHVIMNKQKEIQVYMKKKQKMASKMIQMIQEMKIQHQNQLKKTVSQTGKTVQFKVSKIQLKKMN